MCKVTGACALSAEFLGVHEENKLDAGFELLSVFTKAYRLGLETFKTTFTHKLNNNTFSFIFIYMRLKICGIILLVLTATGCTLKYDETVHAEETNPEFSFSNARIVRYKKGDENVRVQADNIEQYKNSSKTYGKNVVFTTFNDKHELETEGSCGYLYADADSEIYELYDGIKLFSRMQNTNFYADILKWNGKAEQLTGGRGDTVKIEKDGTIIYGTGFSASGVSKKYGFSGTVSGQIEAKDKEDSQAQDEMTEEAE